MIGYKVVTKNMKSLGLRKNPNIIKYPFNKWYYLTDNKIKKGMDDWGGIWVTRTLSSARTLQKYMKCQYNKKVRIFKAIIDKTLYANSYRIKTNGLKLLEEIK